MVVANTVGGSCTAVALVATGVVAGVVVGASVNGSVAPAAPPLPTAVVASAWGGVGVAPGKGLHRFPKFPAPTLLVPAGHDAMQLPACRKAAFLQRVHALAS